jgi:hypothetical protein
MVVSFCTGVFGALRTGQGRETGERDRDREERQGERQVRETETGKRDR